MMERLFEDEAALRASGYLFRITDNGGETQDRFTIVTCDGDYFASDETPFYPLGFFQSGEGIDVQGLSDRVEAGTEHDLRWIDLPADVRRAVMGRLNDGFADWLATGGENVPTSRRAVKEKFSGTYDAIGKGIYRTAKGFRVADADGRERDGGPFATFAEAVRWTLPQDYDLAGPEYHSTVDLWSDEGGPRPLWNCRDDPARPYEVTAVRLADAPPVGAESQFIDIADARDLEDARAIAEAWVAENPDKAPRYRLAYSHKAENTLHDIPARENV